MAWIEEENEQAKLRERFRISQAWQLIKKHPVLSLLITGGMWCGKEVLAVTLHPIFDTCGTALQNTSLNAWQKLCSMEYIAAAKYNMTDLFIGPVFVVVFAFLAWLCLSQIQVAKVHRNLKNYLAANLKRENHFKCLVSTAMPGGAQKELCELLEGNRKEREMLVTDFLTVRTAKRSTVILLFISSIILILSLSFSFSVYQFKSDFQRECDILRPYMSDSDYHRLIRQWTMMTAQTDYLAIEKQLAKIRGQIELYDNAELVNEIFRAKAAAQEEGKRNRR